MSQQAITKRSPGSVAMPVTTEQHDLILRTVAQGATADELALYFYDCQRQGVHPLDKLIHFTKRQGKYTPVTSIDLMRTRAADSGEYAGSDDAVFRGEVKKPDFEATVTVYRMVKNQRCPFTATARWSEYKPDAGQSGRGDVMWQKMPHTMLGKVAEALALRKAFPRSLAGLYAKEELDQAGEGHGGWGGSGSKEAQEAVRDRKLAELRDYSQPPYNYSGDGRCAACHQPGGEGHVCADVVETPTPAPSVATTASSGGPVTIVGARPAADPRTGRYLYPEQAEHLKSFAKAKKAIGPDAYYRCLQYHDSHYAKSTEINNWEDGEILLQAMRDIAAAQAKTRKLKSDQAKAEMDAASLLPSREGSGCPIHISNQIAAVIKALKTPWEEANMAMQTTLHDRRKEWPNVPDEDHWAVILLGLQDVLKKREAAK